jgi:hypothetical protein
MGGGATFTGMPYHCAKVPRSGCRFVFWAMLDFHVELCAFTGSPEMSAFRMLSAGKSAQVVPGSDWAATGVVSAIGTAAPSNAVSPTRASVLLM